MFDLDRYLTDEQAEVEGVWVPMGQGGRLLIARMGNPEYRRVRDMLEEPHRTAIRAGVLAEDIATEIQIKTFARTILLDWEGVARSGEEVAYSLDAAEEALAMKDFRADVLRLSMTIELFRKERLEQDSGN